MPVQLGRDNQSCFARWGSQGAKYYYECGNEQARDAAKEKAYKQGIAIGEFVDDKISFDYDETLTRKNIQDIAKKYVDEDVDVYVISARHNVEPIYKISDELGIPRDRVFAMGSNKAKLDKIKELGITKHYDNNEDIINSLGTIGKLVKLAETYSDYPEAVKEAAARGIRLNKEVNNKCATQVGKVRAQQLANGEPISLDTIKRMYSYLSRAKEYYNPNDDKACGTISYLLWGGEPALAWSERKLAQLEKKELSIHQRFANVINFLRNGKN